MALQTIVTASLVVIAAYVISKLYAHRVLKNNHIPQHPRSFLFGHVVLFGKYTARGKTDRHPDYIVRDLANDIGKPPVMAVDNWPIIPPLVYVFSHDIAEQITRASTQYPYSTPKASSIERLGDLLGETSILRKEGLEWKRVRKLYNQGFSPQYLLTLLPVILDKAKIYISHLDRLASAGEVFSMEDYTTNLTFDIIGAVTMGEDMNAQHADASKGGSLIAATKELGQTYAKDRLLLPWYFIPLTSYRRRQLGNRVRRELKGIIERHFEESKQATQKAKGRSILDLSLQDQDVLTAEFLNETSDQLKTFLFAGHDTTSMVISFTMYELARTPHALQAVRDELDELFGAEIAKDPSKLCEALLAPGGKEKVSQMTYIAAVVKETMRLWPPAATTRMTAEGSGLNVTTDQGELNLDGNWVHICHFMVHRDPAVYGETAEDFVPERWLPGGSAVDLPVSAWRAFERGPRNCIGLELANIEAKVILALLAHPYSFEKVGLGETDLDANGKPTLNHCRQFKTKSDMYLTMRLLPKPADKMMMKVHRV